MQSLVFGFCLVLQSLTTGAHAVEFTCGATHSIETALPRPVTVANSLTIRANLTGEAAADSALTPVLVVVPVNSNQTTFRLAVGETGGDISINFRLSGTAAGLYPQGMPSILGSVHCPNDDLGDVGWWRRNSPWVIPVFAVLGICIIVVITCIKRRHFKTIGRSVTSTRRAVSSVIGSVRRVENVEMDSGSVVRRNVTDGTEGPNGLPSWEAALPMSPQEMVIGAAFPLADQPNNGRADWTPVDIDYVTDAYVGSPERINAYGHDPFIEGLEGDYSDTGSYSYYDETGSYTGSYTGSSVPDGAQAEGIDVPDVDVMADDIGDGAAAQDMPQALPAPPTLQSGLSPSPLDTAQPSVAAVPNAPNARSHVSMLPSAPAGAPVIVPQLDLSSLAGKYDDKVFQSEPRHEPALVAPVIPIGAPDPAVAGDDMSDLDDMVPEIFVLDVDDDDIGDLS